MTEHTERIREGCQEMGVHLHLVATMKAMQKHLQSEETYCVLYETSKSKNEERSIWCGKGYPCNTGA